MDLGEANAILGSLMVRYNEILREIADDALAPIFWVHRTGTVIAGDWAKGFRQAIMLRADAWEPLFTSASDGALLVPILSLCCDENGSSLLGLPPELLLDLLLAPAVAQMFRCVSTHGSDSPF